MRQYKEYTIFDNVTPQAITSSTDATPIVITKNSHGLSTGDKILIYGHATNVAANGLYKITKLTADTFSLQDINTGANIAGSGAGAGGATGIFVTAPKIILAEDFRNIELFVATAGTATMTLNIAGSLGKNTPTVHGDTPNFGATVTESNPYTFLQVIDLDSGSAYNGSTGIALTGSSTYTNGSYEVNINAIKYITVFPVSWTQGSVTIKMKLFNNL